MRGVRTEPVHFAVGMRAVMPFKQEAVGLILDVVLVVVGVVVADGLRDELRRVAAPTEPPFLVIDRRLYVREVSACVSICICRVVFVASTNSRSRLTLLPS